MIWKRLADFSWLALIVAFGVWLAGWLLKVYTYTPSRSLVVGVVGYLALFEFLALVNREQGDTLSERIRKLSTDRPMVALVFGLVGGSGLVLGSLEVEPARLQAVGVVAILSILAGHFFMIPAPGAGKPSVTGAFGFGALYGVGATVQAWAGFDGFNSLLSVVVVALYGFMLGGRYFPLKG